jgi:hypothetical protein
LRCLDAASRQASECSFCHILCEMRSMHTHRTYGKASIMRSSIGLLHTYQTCLADVWWIAEAPSSTCSIIGKPAPNPNGAPLRCCGHNRSHPVLGGLMHWFCYFLVGQLAETTTATDIEMVVSIDAGGSLSFYLRP